MNCAKPTLEWLILEDKDGEIPALAEAPPPRAHKRVSPAVLAGVCVLLAAGVIGGRALIHTANEGLATIDRELQATIAVEGWESVHASEAALAGNGLGLANTAPVAAQDAKAARPHAAFLGTEVAGVTFHGGVAEVAMMESRTYPDGELATRRMVRFYRFDGQGWGRVIPDDSFLGAPLTLQSEHAVFTYRARDQAVIEHAAARLDASYSAMRTALGLPPPEDRLTIVIGDSASRPPRPMLTVGELHLPSPSLLAVPVDLPLEQSLVWQALPLLATRTLNEAKALEPPPTQWGFMERVVYQWLLVEHNELLAAWRADVLAWRLNGDWQRMTDDGQVSALLRELCRSDRVWQRLPWLDGSGSVAICVSPQPSDVARLFGGAGPLQLYFGAGPLRLWQTQDRPLSLNGESSVERVDPILATTMLDYAMSAYGDNAAGRLWHGFYKYPSWEELIPAVFAVTVEEFERGWYEYQLRPNLDPPAVF